MDKIAQVQQTMDFDPWGARRATNWAAMSSTELTNTFFKNHSVSNSVGTTALTSRGFTGHEMLDEVGIIHMNGRIYDAKLGRFLQADPFIDQPYDTQMLNRYSYVRNNPLNAIDPSGYFIFTLAAIINGVLLAAEVITLTTALITAFAIGFVGTMYYGGSFGDALLAGISGAALTFAGVQLFPGGGGFAEFAKYGAQMGVLGGITAALQGGKFGHGFTVAGVSAFVGGKIIGGIKDAGARIISRMVLGGSLTKATGGKFANGAAAAAFSAIVSSAVTAAQASSNPPDTRQNSAASKANLTDEQVSEIDQRVLSATKKLVGKSFGSGREGTKAAQLAMHQNEELSSIAQDFGVEPWGVTGGEDNTILDIGTGYSSKAAYGSVKSLIRNSGHTIWHRHPSGSGIWAGDFSAASSNTRYNVFASGNNVLEGWYVNATAYKMGASLTVERHKNFRWTQVEYK